MVVIVGAGMAGLLAANMLRRHGPVVVEAGPSLPNNHSALLRFRTNAVGEVLGVPFRRVKVIKTVVPWRNPAADALAYSLKCLGEYRSDRSVLSGTEVVERWIAPSDLVERMAEDVHVEYGEGFEFPEEHDKVISTIPMPDLMMALRYPHASEVEFNAVHGFNVVARVRNCDAYATALVPDPDLPFSRVSVTGSDLIVECPGKDPSHFGSSSLVYNAASLLGLVRGHVEEPRVIPQRYAKIVPIDEHQRKSFIFWASSVQGRAFSLGRFSTWRPGLLLDDVVRDVRLIEGWMNSSTPGYDMDLHAGRRTR